MTLKLKTGTILTSTIKFNYLNNFSVFEGIIILTTKSFGNKALAEKLKAKAAYTPIVILQNGLGIEQPFISNGFYKLY
ncbi:2-dehydropantoate 2-reductase N-terminal domain-containing protein [Mesonia maritima]|uniref:Ketopantoate reductase n=1 Tax=Mesonia maritima TaxID=1793873 RepID=A0ABU1K9J4_9FLAO|nr:2-dehydropantoate 2-reductase N-terminal domain-containing protein [Mesonia maritima]MDR6302261.1 ketopantoate reductase [Mesonia maritima]